ncbi:MAG: tyrosine recombinase XerC [Clostridia bacterium]|nr:tyrosine recombinase XerC [Clostridia bacterium]
MARLVNYEEFPQIIRDFANYKTTIQNCSIKTVEEYMLDLRTFFRFLLATEKGLDPADSEVMESIDIRPVNLDKVSSVRPENIYEFLMYASTVRGNNWSARSRKLSALRAFYKYLVSKKGVLQEDPTANIESPKPKKALPKFLTLKECTELLEAVQNDAESKTKARDWCIITLFLNCGMRVSELVGISLSDLDPQLRSMRVVGKGNKERVIYLNEACRQAIYDYLLERNRQKPKKSSDAKALFLSTHGFDERISVKTVQHIVKKYLGMAGLESKHYSVHKLRHTAATLMYQSGNVDIRVLKDILGHEQLNTTQIYTHVSDAGMEAAMAANPLSGVMRKPQAPSKESAEDDGEDGSKT